VKGGRPSRDFSGQGVLRRIRCRAWPGRSLVRRQMDVIALWVIVRGEQRRGKEVGGLGGGNWGHWSRPPSRATGKQPWTDPFSEDQLRNHAQVRFSLPNFYPLQNRKNPISPEPSVIYSPNGKISRKKLENPTGFWNNVGDNTSSLFQHKGAFE
jgi:hypothetical protein